MSEFIEIKNLKYPYLAKCECCNRVKDIYYNANIYFCDIDTEKRNKNFVVGDLIFCKNCGENFSRAIGEEKRIDEFNVKTFKFN